jgi:glycosyltransferase involved in cell wall biosynthesis
VTKFKEYPAKKILIVLTSLCAEGTPVLVLEMCRWWHDRGFQLLVVTLNATPTDLAPEFQQLGIPIECLNLPDRGYWRYGQMVTDFYRLSRQFKPDALLSMPLGWHTFIAYGACLAGVRQIAAHVGNYPPYWTGSTFRKFRWQIQLGRPVTKKLICCSHYVRQGTIQHFGVRDSESVTVYNGCPVERLLEQVDLGRQQKQGRPLRIGMVARLEKHKDHPTLIRAARLLKERRLAFKVQLIGEGTRRAEYEDLIRDQDVEDCVQLLGMRRDIPNLLEEMDIFVFSAKPDEGLGVALIEAMAAGVPVIATDVGACREVLDEGKLGILVPPENPQQMAEAICRIANSPEKAQFRTNKARERVFRDFTIEKMAHEYARCLGLIM